MKKCSFEDRCPHKVTCACKCTTPNLYFCDVHFAKHMRNPGNHVTECMIVELSHDQTRQMLPKLKDLLNLLERERNSVVDNAEVLIECINREAMKALIKINEFEKVVGDLISQRSVEKEFYEKI